MNKQTLIIIERKDYDVRSRKPEDYSYKFFIESYENTNRKVAADIALAKHIRENDPFYIQHLLKHSNTWV